MPQDGYVGAVVTRWRAEAGRMRDLGHEQSARQFEQCAAELEAERVAYLGEELSAREAARESGYSPEQLGRLARAGTITLRRGDLPRRPGVDGLPRPAVVRGAGATAAPGGRRSLADEINAERGLPLGGLPFGRAG